jgi:E2F-associated phosphoprotein
MNPQLPLQTIVTSGDEDDDNVSYQYEHDSLDHHEDSNILPQSDDLFDDQADDEDEAYVYKYLRSGVTEPITIVPQMKSSNTLPLSSIPKRQIKALKPRNSDAVLSCPYCFHIVCMDCQQHEYYKNQYRAMFVMGVIVRWDLKLRYDPLNRCLIPIASSSDVVRAEHSIPNRENDSTSINDIIGNDDRDKMDDDVVYYTVCCANCQTTVAALEMADEVYHFSGCLASY